MIYIPLHKQTILHCPLEEELLQSKRYPTGALRLPFFCFTVSFKDNCWNWTQSGHLAGTYWIEAGQKLSPAYLSSRSDIMKTNETITLLLKPSPPCTPFAEHTYFPHDTEFCINYSLFLFLWSSTFAGPNTIARWGQPSVEAWQRYEMFISE